ncbi:ribonuclease H protein, partial [Trifolium medium]|nr:ribonuclease H protein [Trifolium medium]
PLVNWIKCNTDGASTISASSCGGIFRDHSADLIGCFAEKIPYCTAFFVELSGVLRAIELASQHNWHNLWLESDSALVVIAFKNDTMIPWALRNRWFNAKLLMRNMNVIVTHIYREGNDYADILGYLALDSLLLRVWFGPPLIL